MTDSAGEALCFTTSRSSCSPSSFLAWLNYRGVFATLTFNLVITAIAFLAIVVLFSPFARGPTEVLKPRSC